MRSFFVLAVDVDIAFVQRRRHKNHVRVKQLSSPIIIIKIMCSKNLYLHIYIQTKSETPTPIAIKIKLEAQEDSRSTS